MARRVALKQLILDAATYDLDTDQALVYIDKRSPKPCSRSLFFKVKKEMMLDEEMANKRMNEHAKIGFVIKHFQIMDAAEVVHRNLCNTFFTTQNPFAKAAISKEIREYEYLMSDLNTASPIISQMKLKLDNELLNKSEHKEEIPTDDHIPPSACVLPEGFIKSSVQHTHDDRGMAAGTKPADRIF